MEKLNALERSAKYNADNFEPVTVAGTKDILAIAEAFRALEQRAEAAEAKLAELEKQEPVGSFHIYDGRVDGTTDYVRDGEWPINDGELLVYARPAPAADLADLVEDETP